MSRTSPSVWYVAAGYKLPAGVEAYLLHYATELLRHGFDTRIIVFERLPRIEHRYLTALRQRRIPIESLYERVGWMAVVLTAITYVPWAVKRQAARGKGQEEGFRVQGSGLRSRQSEGRILSASLFPLPASLYAYWLKRLAVRRLDRMIRAEKPDVIHIKARLITEAWAVFPPRRTLYQHALSGTVDPSWQPHEVTAFRDFANKIARILVQGQNIATTFAREFGITHPMDVVFTMAPDEGQGSGVRDQGSVSCVQPSTIHRVSLPLRFGILCRFTKQKGIPFILDALKKYRERHGEVDFTFAGQGELEPLIRERVEGEGWKGIRVVRVESPESVLRNLDVFVHPGLDDAMPVSIVEALMCGVPCIGTRVGGVPDLIRDGIEGFLIAPSSADAICAAMSRFASMSREELEAFKLRARQRYEEACKPEVVGAQVAQIYRDVMGKAEESGKG